MTIINDSISVHKVPGEDRREALFTFRDENGPVCHIRTPFPQYLRSAAKVLSWELGSLERMVEVDPLLIERATRDPHQPIISLSGGRISFSPNTVKVVGPAPHILEWPRVYIDTEFAYFKQKNPPTIESTEFSTWFLEYFLPRARKLNPSLSELSDEGVFSWASETIAGKKGHMSHIAIIVNRNGESQRYLGSTTTLDQVLGLEVHSFKPAEDEVEARFAQFQNALQRKNASKERVYERFGVVSELPETQREEIGVTLATMAMRDWAKGLVQSVNPYLIVLQYHGYDIERLKAIETMLAKEKSWTDRHKRTPRKSSVKTPTDEFFIKERFADLVVLDPFYIVQNCIPQLAKRNLEAICEHLGIPFKKGLPRDFLNYISLLIDMGERETSLLEQKYAAADVAVLAPIIEALTPQINSLSNISHATGLSLRSITLKRNALEELIDKSFYEKNGRHRVPDIVKNIELRALKEKARKMRKLPTHEASGEPHLAYVPWVLFIEKPIVSRVPLAARVFELYRESLIDSNTDSITYLRYLEPIAENLLYGLVYVEELNAKYGELLERIGRRREELKPVHEGFQKGWEVCSSISKRYREALRAGIEEDAPKRPKGIGPLFESQTSLAISEHPGLEAKQNYKRAVTRISEGLPKQTQQAIAALGITSEDFLFLSIKRQQLQRNAAAFFWNTRALTTEFSTQLKVGYDGLMQELAIGGFTVTHQRGDIITVVSQRADAKSKLNIMENLLYLGAGK